MLMNSGVLNARSSLPLKFQSQGTVWKPRGKGFRTENARFPRGFGRNFFVELAHSRNTTEQRYQTDALSCGTTLGLSYPAKLNVFASSKRGDYARQHRRTRFLWPLSRDWKIYIADFNVDA
jgi:hypothetical protein